MRKVSIARQTPMVIHFAKATVLTHSPVRSSAKKFAHIWYENLLIDYAQDPKWNAGKNLVLAEPLTVAAVDVHFLPLMELCVSPCRVIKGSNPKIHSMYLRMNAGVRLKCALAGSCQAPDLSRPLSGPRQTCRIDIARAYPRQAAALYPQAE